jgi:hypothetical protein
MKKLLIIFLVPVFITSCQFVNIKGFNDNSCVDVTKYPNSLILKKLKNPCGTYSILIAVIKTQIRVDKYTVNEYTTWAKKQKALLVKINNISARTIKEVVGNKIIKMNNQIGYGVFAISDILLEFSDETIFKSDDITLIILALDNSIDVVNNMAR